MSSKEKMTLCAAFGGAVFVAASWMYSIAKEIKHKDEARRKKGEDKTPFRRTGPVCLLCDPWVEGSNPSAVCLLCDPYL